MAGKLKNARLNDLIGSPSYPSPLDRIRTGKRERAAQLGLEIKNEESFEGNQSFPRTNLTSKINADLSPFNNLELNSISFLPNYKKNFKKFSKTENKKNFASMLATSSTTLGNTLSCNNSRNENLENSFGFDKSWQFYNYFANTDAIFPAQNVTKNPNKALVTINGKNSEILTANDTACELFGYTEDTLIGMKLKDLLDVNSHHKHDIMMESHFDDTGNLVLCTGKLFEAIDSNGIVIPISICMQRLTNDHEQKCLCMIEPVQRITGNFSINVKGQLKSFDDKFLGLFGYLNQKHSVYGKDINEFIPHIKLPMCTITNDTRKQTLTGRTSNGLTIPLTVRILNKEVFNNEEIVFNCIVSFYTNISGLMTIRVSDGLINSYNPIFSSILFGYDEDALKNKPISVLIPSFYEKHGSSNNTTRDTHETSENDEVINKKLHRMLYDDEFSEEIYKKFKSNDFEEEKSFNSKSIDSSNLSIKTSEFTFNTTETTNHTNNDIDIEDEEDDDDDSTAKYCYQCGVELKYKRQSDHVLNQIVKSSNTPIEKCTSFVYKHDFSSLSNSSSVSSATNLSQLNNTNCLDESKMEQNNSIDISDYQNRYICDDCIEKINGGKSILPLRENVLDTDNESTALTAVSGYNEDDDTEADVSLIANEAETNSEADKLNNKNIPTITTTLDDSLAKTNFLKLRLNMLKDKNNSISNVNTHEANLSTNANSNNNLAQVTSTPAPNEDRLISAINKNYFLNEGTFCGYGKHKDGSLIQIIYQRKIIEISKDKSLVCIWICKDPETDKSMMEHSFDQSQLKKSFINENSFCLQPSVTLPTVNQYSFEYEDISTLGRGASGFVRLARRRQDSFEVVTKYIRKHKIPKDSWINDERYGQTPLEVSILCKLDHPNIVKVLEVFQDDDYIQMVMQRHGCGMDLFEFIDRQPIIDEPLASYIFRQLVSAVSYLHSNDIVHRDIKDENIVINEEFRIKLIDFGSAAYMQKGKKFAKFCGTLDYCSPEVLLGNKYNGPELDCWTIGIALYTLVFAENPFFDADETIECILKPPFRVSKDLMKLLFTILYPKPELRATIKDIETNDWVSQFVDINNYKWENVIKNTVFNGNNAGDNRTGMGLSGENELAENSNILKERVNNLAIKIDESIQENKTQKSAKLAHYSAEVHSKSF